MKKIVIIGASIAGHTVAIALRQQNKDAAITLLTQEKFPLYDKRKLLDFLSGKAKEKDLMLMAEASYKENNIDFIKEAEVMGMSTHKRLLHIKDEDSISYDFLVICSGTSFVFPQISGVHKEGVFGPASLTDCKELSKFFMGDSFSVSGSGDYALKFANALASRGKEVRLFSPDGVNPQDLPAGIELMNTEITEIIGEAEVLGVRIKEGKIVGTSAVIFADKFAGNIDFIKNTGIETNNGLICVDENKETNIKNILACGSVSYNRANGNSPKSWDESAQDAQILTQVLANKIIS